MPIKVTHPSQSLFDKNFRYRRAAETDIRKTFTRVTRQIKLAEQQALAGQQELLPLQETASTVVALPARCGRGAS